MSDPLFVKHCDLISIMVYKSRAITFMFFRTDEQMDVQGFKAELFYFNSLLHRLFYHDIIFYFLTTLKKSRKTKLSFEYF